MRRQEFETMLNRSANTLSTIAQIARRRLMNGEGPIFSVFSTPSGRVWMPSSRGLAE